MQKTLVRLLAISAFLLASSFSSPAIAAMELEQVGRPVAASPADASPSEQILHLVRRGPAQLAVDASYEQFAAIAKLSQKELDALVPQLLLLLNDKKHVPYSEMLMDAGAKQVRHQAADALAVIAGISRGTFTVRGGMLADDAQANDAHDARTVAAWAAWWGDARGKTRADWLDARRPQFEQALEQCREGKAAWNTEMTLLLAGLSGDVKALPALREAADAELALRRQGKASQMRPLALSYIMLSIGRLGGEKERGFLMDALRESSAAIDTTTLPVGAVLQAIAMLGDATLVPELVDITRTVNARQTADSIRTSRGSAASQRSAYLRAAANTLNKLTGTNLRAEQQIIVDRWVYAALDPTAFDTWLKAAKR